MARLQASPLFRLELDRAGTAWLRGCGLDRPLSTTELGELAFAICKARRRQDARLSSGQGYCSPTSAMNAHAKENLQ